MTDQAERIVVLEQNVVALKAAIEEREKLHAEFRLRTDERLELLIKLSNELTIQIDGRLTQLMAAKVAESRLLGAKEEREK